MKFHAFLLLAFITAIISGYSQLIHETKIWDQARHNAFTDITRFKSHFYCVFREGDGHKPLNGDHLGKIRILRSKDGKTWNSIAHLDIPDYDLRDPKLSITPDNKLMIIIGGTKYIRKIKASAISFVSFTKNGRDFTLPVPVDIDDKIKSRYDWIWRITWFDGTGYGVVYQDPKMDQNYITKLVKTNDGIKYSVVTNFQLAGKPNEATIRFNKNGEMFILMRRENYTNGLLGQSSPPYTAWKWTELNFRLGGPDFLIFDDGNICLGTRIFDPDLRGSNNRTSIMFIKSDGVIKNKFELQSNGDTGYPGLLKDKKNLWISYYSSHEGKASIYLAKIRLKDLKIHIL